MSLLYDLGKLVDETRNELKEFDYKDFSLSNTFKKALREVITSTGSNIDYKETTAIITNSAGQKIYAPNQWFLLASKAVPLVKEIMHYRSYTEKYIDKYFEDIKKILPKDIKEKKDVYQKARLGEENEPVTSMFLANMQKMFYNGFVEDHYSAEDAGINSQYLIRFIEDSKWWLGGKGIERTNDYYVSPALGVLNLVNASQSYVATLAFLYSTNEQLFNATKNIVSQNDEEGMLSTVDEYQRAAKEIQKFLSESKIDLEEQKSAYEKVLKDFQEKFSPEKLKQLQDEEILKTMFYSNERTDDSLCYWLEVLKDSRLYWGNISGGSAYKFGLFQKKENGKWTTGSPQKPVELSETEAVTLGKNIRDAIVKGAEVIENASLNSLEDYEKLDDDLRLVMGDRYPNWGWIHKYFSMIFPEKLSGYHSTEWQRHVLFSLRIMPSRKYYARSGQIAMVSKYGSWVYPDIRVIVNERFGYIKKFLRIGTTGDNRFYGDEWKKKGIVAIGWKNVGSLEDYVTDSQMDKKGISNKLLEEYYSGDDNGSGNAVATKKAGELVAFYNSDENTLFVPMNGKRLLGIVDNIGSYYFDSTSEMPHVKKGHWISCFGNDEKLPYEYAGHLTSCSEINDDENLMFLYDKYYYSSSETDVTEINREEEMENKPKIELVFKTGFGTDYARNRIVFGAPGTGKSHMIKEDCAEMVEKYKAGFERVTFHPDYTYAQFVGTYKPVTDSKGSIRYDFVPGPFMRVYANALQSALQGNDVKPYILIVEELNRAKVAAVFGDVFQLLDRDDDGVSEYGIQASEDIKKYLAKKFDASADSFDELKLPDNMYIWATMNSADQGVFPMDTAFKRRWSFDYLGINEKDEQIKGKIILGTGDYSAEVEWNILRKAINDKLTKDYKINEDKLLGPFFMEKKMLKTVSDSDETILDREGFIRVFKSKVLMYLFEDAAKQHKHKLFSGCSDTNKYSSICDDFDRKGIRIFGDNFEKDYYDPLKES